MLRWPFSTRVIHGTDTRASDAKARTLNWRSLRRRFKVGPKLDFMCN
jgi:hypothetical protein